MDGFHLSNAFLDELGLRDRKSAPETFDVASYVALLQNVRHQPEQEWWAPDFSRVTDEPVPNGYCIKPEVRLVVTEGNYLLLQNGLWNNVKSHCNEVWLLEVDHEIET